MQKWHLFYIAFCDLLAEKLCYAKRSKVGAVIVKDHNILAYGYNGSPHGFPNICEDIVDEEIWKETNHKTFFVSTHGRAKQIINDKEKILPLRKNKKLYTVFKINGAYYTIHLLMAKVFIKNPEPKYYNETNHIDFNKNNNHINNIEWCTTRYNCHHRSKHLFNSELPVGITIDKFRKTDKYLVHIYRNQKLIGKRFKTLEEAIKFRNANINEKEFITYKYEPQFVTKPEVIHAEINAIAKAARQGISVKGATMYVSISPCIECAKLIIQSGISKVIYKEEYRDRAGLELLTKAEVDSYKISEIV